MIFHKNYKIFHWKNGICIQIIGKQDIIQILQKIINKDILIKIILHINKHYNIDFYIHQLNMIQIKINFYNKLQNNFYNILNNFKIKVLNKKIIKIIFKINIKIHFSLLKLKMIKILKNDLYHYISVLLIY